MSKKSCPFINYENETYELKYRLFYTIFHSVITKMKRNINPDPDQKKSLPIPTLFLSVRKVFKLLGEAMVRNCTRVAEICFVFKPTKTRFVYKSTAYSYKYRS